MVQAMGSVTFWLLILLGVVTGLLVGVLPALKFGSAEYFAVVLLGLTSVLALSGKSVMKSMISLFGGILIATVGIDDIYGAVRYDFGTDILRDGINYLAILVGVYALTEALMRFAERFGGKAGPQP